MAAIFDLYGVANYVHCCLFCFQVNPSTSDWSLSATISSPQFSGPPAFVAHALTTTCYPLTFSPQIEGTVKVNDATAVCYYCITSIVSSTG